MQPSKEAPSKPEPDVEVRMLPILAVLGAVALVSVGVLSLMDPSSLLGDEEAFFRSVGVALVVLGGALFVAAVGLWLRRRWAWWLSVGIDVAYIVLLAVANLIRPFRDPTWLVAPAFAAVVLLWLYVVRRDFGVDTSPRVWPPPS